MIGSRIPATEVNPPEEPSQGSLPLPDPGDLADWMVARLATSGAALLLLALIALWWRAGDRRAARAWAPRRGVDEVVR